MIDFDFIPKKINGYSSREYDYLLIIINNKTDDYFVFEGVAGYIWSRINGKNSVCKIAHDITCVYDIDYESSLSDTLDFINELSANHLIKNDLPLKNYQKGTVERKTQNYDTENRIRKWAIEKIIPYEGIIELTYKCNQNCLHCYIDNKRNFSISYGNIKKILNELASSGCLKIIFTGGELFTHPQLFEILSYARNELSFYITLLTNGTLINDEIISHLLDLSIRDIAISIYSDNSSEHDKMTRLNGSYKKVIQAISLLKSAGIKVTINCPITIFTKNAIAGIVQLAGQMEIDFSFDPYIIPLRNQKSKNRLALTKNEIVDVLRQIAKTTDSSLEEFTKINKTPCNAGKSTFCIDPFGEVYPCLDLRISAGNAIKTSFSNIWNEGESFKKLRNVKEKELVYCVKCELKDYCKRCYGRAYHDDNDFYGCSSQARMQAEIRKILKNE